MMNFMEHEKAWNEFTKTFPKKEYSVNDPRIKTLVEDLTDRLANENLHEDGELPFREAVAKEKDLMKKWGRLEKKVNQKLELIE